MLCRTERDGWAVAAFVVVVDVSLSLLMCRCHCGCVVAVADVSLLRMCHSKVHFVAERRGKRPSQSVCGYVIQRCERGSKSPAAI